jgi:sigma-B regulation protein RsbU (phosphoserine phosphatase)
MRDKPILLGFLLGAAILLLLGRDLTRGPVFVTYLLAFGGTTAVAILGLLVYRFRLELAASRQELAQTEAELEFARKVQQELFPRRLPAAEGLEFAAVCIPARGISGDYYDMVPLGGGRLGFAIADVSGKGISAAILMANLQALLRATTAGGDPPPVVCRKLNFHLCQVMDSSRFATFFYAEWAPDERRLRYVNAGHNPPLLIQPRVTVALTTGGIPLGIFPDSEYEMGETTLDPGDVLVLYSDGITEALDSGGGSEEFGERRLEATVRTHRGAGPGEIERSVLDAVRRWSDADPADDMTLVIVRATARDEAVSKAAGSEPDRGAALAARSAEQGGSI